MKPQQRQRCFPVVPSPTPSRGRNVEGCGEMNKHDFAAEAHARVGMSVILKPGLINLIDGKCFISYLCFSIILFLHNDEMIINSLL